MSSPPTSVGRRRVLGKQLSTEDHALNLIAREAEARLAAKRAARAEARSIRMKELEKAQKEADDQMDMDEESSEDVSSKKKTVTTSRVTSGLLQDDDRDVCDNASDAQLVHLKDSVRELDGKYRKAMVNIAQLDNERQALQYQVECLKDQLEDMDEICEDLKAELAHKLREFNKLARDHAESLAELEKMRLVLQHRESLLQEHGINLDGTLMQRDASDISAHEHDLPFVEDKFASEREKLLGEIRALKEEVAGLRVDVDPGRDKSVNQENLRLRVGGEGNEIERSFVDVSDEADAIREDDRHTGLINNNERNDDFEVIDQGSQPGVVLHFEDTSMEKSGLSSLLSSAVHESVCSAELTGSVESEPLEISVNVSDARSAADQKAADDYDIVNEVDSLATSGTGVGTALDISKLTARPEPERSPSPLPNEFNISKYVAWDVDDPRSPVSIFSVDQTFSTTNPAPDDAGVEEGAVARGECDDSVGAVFDITLDTPAPAEASRLSTPDHATRDEPFVNENVVVAVDDSVNPSAVVDNSNSTACDSTNVLCADKSVVVADNVSGGCLGDESPAVCSDTCVVSGNSVGAASGESGCVMFVENSIMPGDNSIMLGDNSVPVEADNFVPVEGDNSLPVEADSFVPVEADNSLPVEADSFVPVEADNSCPVEADNSQVISLDSSGGTSMDVTSPVDISGALSRDIGAGISAIVDKHVVETNDPREVVGAVKSEPENEARCIGTSVEHRDGAILGDSYDAAVAISAVRESPGLDTGEEKVLTVDSFEQPVEIVSDTKLDVAHDIAGLDDSTEASKLALVVGTSAANEESVADVLQEAERAEVRNHVDASCSEVSTSQLDNAEVMSTGATFGVFAITGQRDRRQRGSSSKEAVFAVTGRAGDTFQHAAGNPEGWVVQVERVHSPGVKEPPADVKVVEIDTEGAVSVPDLDAQEPVPKERKKKKSKKSKKGRDSVVSETEVSLGDARPHSPGARRASAREEECRLSVGMDQRTESVSDYSDSEPIEAKAASKKGKKEGCKSQ